MYYVVKRNERTEKMLLSKFSHPAVCQRPDPRHLGGAGLVERFGCDGWSLSDIVGGGGGET